MNSSLLTDLSNPVAAAKAARPPIRRGVIGIFQENGAFLLIQRAESVSLPGTWCFPGGHIERHETPRRAVIREMREELGVEVEPRERLGAVQGRPDVLLAIWGVRRLSGPWRLDPREVSDMGWFTLREIRQLANGLPSNLKVAEMLEKANWHQAPFGPVRFRGRHLLS